ncbi:MAG TPA: hypothetical protein VJM32_04955 [Candidatus Saccharimonadales bacterium]|nr:hypothetical protein [Candidatus Saccharimonadales bacterium]
MDKKIKQIKQIKQITRILLCVFFTVIGLWIAYFSILQLIGGQWLWLIILIAAAAIITAGVRIGIGDRPKDIARDLLFVLFRTH